MLDLILVKRCVLAITDVVNPDLGNQQFQVLSQREAKRQAQCVVESWLQGSAVEAERQGMID